MRESCRKFLEARVSVTVPHDGWLQHIKLDNTRRARVAPKGLLCRGVGSARIYPSKQLKVRGCGAIFIISALLASTTSIHDYADILSQGSPSTKWFSFRTLFWTRGFSIARETYKRLVKNRSADRFRDIGCGYTDGYTDRLTDFSRPLYTIAPSGQ